MTKVFVRRNPEFSKGFANSILSENSRWRNVCSKHRHLPSDVFKGTLFKNLGNLKIRFTCFDEPYMTSFDERWIVLKIIPPDLDKWV